jgi:membrane protein required for colicin V production
MNWLDVVLLVILAASVFTSFRKGFSREVIGLVAVVLALLLGSWFYGTAGALFAPYLSSTAAAHFAGFLLVFCGVLVLGAVVGAIVGKFLRVTGLSIFDHILGAGFGLARGVLIAVALVLGMMAFSPSGRPPESVVRSRTAPYVVDAAKLVASIAPHEVREGFRKTYGQVKSVWDKTLDDGVRKLPGAEKRHDERKI